MNNYSRTLKKQREIASLFGVSVATVRRWHRLGCPRFYVGTNCAGSGSRPRYDVQQVRAWLESRTAGTAGKEVEA